MNYIISKDGVERCGRVEDARDGRQEEDEEERQGQPGVWVSRVSPLPPAFVLSVESGEEDCVRPCDDQQPGNYDERGPLYNSGGGALNFSGQQTSRPTSIQTDLIRSYL